MGRNVSGKNRRVDSGAILPITFNDCGEIVSIIVLDIKFKICTLCWGGGYDQGWGV